MQGEWLWRLRLSWLGTRYVGWQRQPNGLSIQQVVEEALSDILGGQRVRVHAAGRTDAGVHAIEQLAAVKVKRVRREAHELWRGLNARLPDDIACLGVDPAPRGFNPRGTIKLYRYRVLNRAARCPFRHDRAWHVREALDVEAMAAAARPLVGEHDFTSFRASGCTAKHPVRTLLGAAVRREGDEIHVEFEGNGFLRHQVRIMVGALVEVGAGRQPVDWLAELLAARDRRLGARTAPAHGLWLVRARIPDEPPAE